MTEMTEWWPKTKLRPKRFIAMCPDCDRRIEFWSIPIGNWPQCEDCFQSMTFYERSTEPRPT
jgi:hypothetical protein